MSGCGCDSGTPCGCSGTTHPAISLAAQMGGSVGSLVAEVAARLSVGMGASATTHARNRANAALGLPYITPNGELVVENNAKTPVGYGLSLPTAGTPRLGRSSGWRQMHVPVDGLAPYGP